jgi:hypothetical protein
MNTKPIFNILGDFDFSHLNNSEFKEDAVREEIILPIIKGLGYGPGKPHQIIRSRALLHPYVSIGSKKHPVNIIPDYLFEVEGRPAWILDAKAPGEDLKKSKHVEQAYSYAIHSEVRVEYYALCNGHNFVLYHISKNEPILDISLQAISLFWGDVKRILAPANVFSGNQLKINKDFGLHLERLGFSQVENMFFPEVPITHIGQLDPNLFTTSTAVISEGETYLVSFDFDLLTFQQLNGKIPKKAFEELLIRETGSRKNISFPDQAYLLNLECTVGKKLEENANEIFRPLWVNRFI